MTNTQIEKVLSTLKIESNIIQRCDSKISHILSDLENPAFTDKNTLVNFNTEKGFLEVYYIVDPSKVSIENLKPTHIVPFNFIYGIVAKGSL